MNAEHQPATGQIEIDWTQRNQKLNLIDRLFRVAIKTRSRQVKRLADFIRAIDSIARDASCCQTTLYEIARNAGYSEATARRAMQEATEKTGGPIVGMEKRGTRYIADPHRRDSEGRYRRKKASDGNVIAEKFLPRDFEHVYEARIFWSDLADRVAKLESTACPGQTVSAQTECPGQAVCAPVPSSLPAPAKQSARHTSYSAEKRTKRKERPKSQRRFTDGDMEVARFMFSLLQQENEFEKPPTFENWANDIRLMRERDPADRTHDNIRSLFAWAHSHNFWHKNIRSPGKLREKWDQLVSDRKGRTGQSRRTDDKYAGARAFAAEDESYPKENQL